MKKAIILHGTQGSPEGNWFQWLDERLAAEGLEVWLPQLPHAEQPSLRAWLDFVHEQCPFVIDKNTLIVGHSSGAILALLIARENSEKVGTVVCVSVFHDNSLKWSPNDRLFDVSFDWPVIRANVANQIICIHSDDDPYVPLDQARYVADKVDAEMIIVEDQGHFNLEKSPAYAKFPRLIQIFKERKIV